MKVKTAEQYTERFKRRGKKHLQREGDYEQDLANCGLSRLYGLKQVRDVNNMRKPDHGARAQRIDGVFEGRLVKQQKPAVPNVAGIPLEGDMGSCSHVLVDHKPYLEPEAFIKNTRGRLKYHPFAYPCIVDHGMKRIKRGGRWGLLTHVVPVQGKKGEHRDNLGRTW